MTKGYDTAKERRAKAGRWTGVLVDLYREINLPPRTFQDDIEGSRRSPNPFNSDGNQHF